MDKKPRPPLKPLKILVNLFSKSKSKSQEMVTGGGGGGAHTAPVLRTHHYESQLSPPLTIRTCYADDLGGLLHPSMPTLLSSSDSVSMTTNHPGLYTEFEALHLSRQDNPFIQQQLVLSLSQDNLDALSFGGGGGGGGGGGVGWSFDHPQSQSGAWSSQHSQFSPPYSPTRSCDPLVLEEVHAHLVRSPPPCYWPERSFPLSPRSNGTFSPDSSEGGGMLGNDLDCGVNYYKRSQSEEHILLSPCSRSGDLLKVGTGTPAGGAFSPVRGVTPELLMTTSLHAGESSSAGKSRAKVRRNHTLTCDGEALSPLRNQAGGCDCGATSISSYTMNHHCPSSSGRRIPCARNQQQQQQLPQQQPQSASHKKSSGVDSFFSSWRPRRRRQSTSDGQQHQQQKQQRRQQQDAKSMENLQDDDRCQSSSLRLPDGCSPSARKSVCSMGTGLGNPPRNCATLFTKFKVKDTPMFIA